MTYSQRHRFFNVDRVSGVRLALLAVVAITVIVTAINSANVYQEYLPGTSFRQLIIDVQGWHWLLLIPILTCFNLGARYLKWAFLLRTFGLLAPSREILRTYLVSFTGNVVPFYIAYLVRLVPFSQNIGKGFLVLVLDLMLDFLAISVVGLSRSWWVFLILVGIGLALAILLSQSPRSTKMQGVGTICGISRIVFAAICGVVIWWITALAVGCALKAFGAEVDWLRSVQHFALSQQAGVALFPLSGITSVGRGLIEMLVAQGIPIQVAVGATIALRVWTFWLTLGVALTVLIAWRWMGAIGQEKDARFDAVAARYQNDMPEHMRLRYLEKKIGLNKRYLPLSQFVEGLDAGCGQGWYVNEMTSSGYIMTGLDYSAEQLKVAESSRPPGSSARFVGGSIVKLPFPRQTFDFVYSINTLHHLSSVSEQSAAFAEIHRVLRAGGRAIIHEMNIRNPLFRLYLSYVFPLIKAIDEGTEIWMKGDEPSLMQGFQVLAKEYQTVLPDITPRFLLSWLSPLENWFESNRVWRHWAAHVTYVLEKAPPPDRPDSSC